MRLIFEGGTLVLKDFERPSLPPEFSHLKWDKRINSFRGPAYLLDPILTELRGNGFATESPPITGEVPIFRSACSILRPYQEAALDAWETTGRRGIVALPTGGGKTQLAIAAIQKVKRPTLVLVPTLVLLQQWVSVVEKQCGTAPGVLGDGTRLLSPVTVATFESAYRHMARMGDMFDFIVVDEVHHFGRGLRDEAIEMSMASFRLGLTGTVPEDQKWHQRIGQILGPVIHELNLSQLRGTYLSDFEVIRVHVELNESERQSYDREMSAFRKVNRAFRAAYPNGSWKDFSYYASRTEDGRRALKGIQAAQKVLYFPAAKRVALSNILEHNSDAKMLIFTADTATAYEVSRRHLIMPITAEINRKEREEYLMHFRRDEISKLVSCQVLNEGFDVPEANVAVILGGKRGIREHLQRIGRILRMNGDKKAKIYEIVCNRTMEIAQANRRGEKLES